MEKNNLTRNQEIEQAFKDTFSKYNIRSVREQYNVIINVLQGNYDYITRENGARDIIEKYGKETVRTAILENALLNNIFSKNMQDMKTKITNHIIELHNPSYLQGKGFTREQAKEIVEKGIDTQLQSISNYSQEGFVESYLTNIQTGLSQEEMEQVINSSHYIKEAIDSIERVYINSLTPEKREELRTEEYKVLNEAENILKASEQYKRQEKIIEEQRKNFETYMNQPIDVKAVDAGRWLIISSLEMDFINNKKGKANSEEYDKFMTNLRTWVSNMSDEDILSIISSYSIKDVEKFGDIKNDKSFQGVIDYLKEKGLDNEENKNLSANNAEFHRIVQDLEKHEIAVQAEDFLYDEFMKKNEMHENNLTPEQKEMEEKFWKELDKMTDDEKIVLVSSYDKEEIKAKSRPLAQVVELSNGRHWFASTGESSYDKLIQNEHETPILNNNENVAEVQQMLNNQYSNEDIVKMAESTIGSNPNMESDTTKLLNEADEILRQASDMKLAEITRDLDDIQEQISNYQEGLKQEEMPNKEVDNSLDNYVLREQAINQNQELSEEEKKQKRQELWAEFDNYVEKTPENKGRAK